MAARFAHIILVSSANNAPGIDGPRYQFTYNDGDSSYARVFEEDHLVEFLREELGIDPDVLNDALSKLRSSGSTILSNLDIAQQDAAAMGLQQVASDN